MRGPALPGMQLAVYLIHFDPPFGKNRHYIGITTANRITKRFAEHCTGRGARLTAKAADEGCTLQLARVFWTHDPDDEYRFMLRADEPGFCPVCQGSPPLRSIKPREKTAMHAWRSHQSELQDATSFAATRVLPGMKKGRP